MQNCYLQHQQILGEIIVPSILLKHYIYVPVSMSKAMKRVIIRVIKELLYGAIIIAILYQGLIISSFIALDTYNSRNIFLYQEITELNIL